jgi:hypothetical protein
MIKSRVLFEKQIKYSAQGMCFAVTRASMALRIIQVTVAGETAIAK